MDMEWSEYEQRDERDDRDEVKDRKKSGRGEEKEHRSRERERSRRSGDDFSKEREKEAKELEKERGGSGRERKKDDRSEREKDRSKDNKARDKDHDREKNREKERERDKDRKDRVKEKDREKERDVEKDSDRGRDKERGKEKNRDKEKERDRAKEKEREREREKHKDRDKEKEKEKIKEKDREADQDKEKSRERVSRKSPEENYDRGKDGGKDDKTKLNHENNKGRDVKHGKVSQYSEDEETDEGVAREAHLTTSELENRILKMKEERSKKKTEDVSEVLAWVSRSRKLEEKKTVVKEKALQLSKKFEEQDSIVQGESEDEETAEHHNLAGVKVLHGIDKVMEGGAVVLTLKDQNILADGDINEDVDMLENVEIGEQKQRDEAYKAAKKKVGTYDDKFNDDPNLEKKMLPQYDDPATDEGVTLDERGRITSEAEKRLEELRRRLQGASTNNHFEDLNLPGKTSSDYYTPEEMIQFKKPKKKKSLRKKEKLDIDALEAEAVSAGLGVGDLGSRNDGKRQAIKEEQNRAEAERRNNAYKTALAKADEASKSLRLEQTLPVKSEEDSVFVEDDEDLYKSLERARKLALKMQEEAPSGPQGVALLAATSASSQTADEQLPTTGESQENKVVFTEMEEFVWGLQLEEEAHKPDGEDVFMQEDEEPELSNEEMKDEPGGWTEVKETEKDEDPSKEDKEDIVPDEIIHEVAVGKGLSGALKLLKERGTLKETIDWGGRNMDKKKSKLVGIVGDDEPKEIQPARQKKDETRTSYLGHSKEMPPPKVYQEKDIRIERTDEFGRILTPKEAFRILSHKFHGKGPGKMKQEKRMKQFQEELKLKQMKSSDTPSLSVERMREAQAQLKTPYLVLSGHVKPGQTSDPRSGFATVEKDLPGGLTPMLGDRKVEHFLGIKRKPESSGSGTPKKTKS
ncbi:SNU66/SART1 family [Trema orientale]|uniref:SNU66/SART1 family n=1 Tax=Trema orientale TaxID=63057 RepID=A0A2P5FWK5_TREOI|nr:SNU66/SART1 family [Trema orientale]